MAFGNKKAAFTAPKAETELAQAAKRNAPSTVSDGKKDLNVSRSYSFPASFHQMLVKMANEQGLEEGRKVSASEVAMSLIKKGLSK